MVVGRPLLTLPMWWEFLGDSYPRAIRINNQINGIYPTKSLVNGHHSHGVRDTTTGARHQDDVIARFHKTERTSPLNAFAS